MGKILTATMGSLRGLLNQHAFLSGNMLAVADGGISPRQLAEALRGDRYLGSEREAELLTLAHRCLKIIDAILPLRIAPGDGNTLKLLVNSRRDPEEIRALTIMLLEPSHE